MSSNKTLERLGVRRITTAQGVTEYRLKSNGLSILLQEDQSTPAVNFMVVYLCGSRDEGCGTTGSAHFFEHLMFKGTRAFDPLEGNGVMEVFGRVGGVLNANTSYDRTRYFECIPAEHLELAIRVEADRMRNLKNRKSDRDSEMTVVRNEFERNENDPGSALFKEVMAAAYKDHSYHHPVIGARSDVEGIPMQRMVEFYDKFYWPNNATVIINGNFDSEKALAWITKYFGRIPRSPKPIPHMYTVEPRQEGERRVELRRAGPLQQLMIAHHIPAASHADIYALNALGQILGGSSKPSSRLYKALVEKSMVNSVSAGAYELKDPGLFMLSASLTAGTSLADVEAALIAEVERVASEGVTEDELRRVKAANRKGTVIQQDDPMAVTNLLSNAVGVDNWKWSINYDDRYDEITVDDIKRVAGTYFARENRTVGHFIPTVGSKKAPVKGEEPKARKGGPRKQKRVKINALPRRTDFASRTVSETLPNGLKVSVVRRGNGAVAINTAIPAGGFFAPSDKPLVSSITAAMLTAGSKGFTKEQIGDAMQELGTGLSFGPGEFALKAANTIEATDLERYLEVVSDVVINPLLDGDELRKRVPMYRANLSRQLTDNGAQANNAFERAIYPEGHPYRPNTLEENLKGLDAVTAEDLKAYHREHYTPQGSVITIVGDVDPAAAIELVRKHFGAWTGPARKAISVPAVSSPLASPDQPREVRIALPDKANVDMIIGHATNLQRTAADFYASRIANNALGQSTIADRLGKVIRAQHGLTYGVTSHFGDSSFGATPWQIGISVAPENIGKALELIRGIVSEYIRDGITENEVQDKVGSLCGSQLVNMRSSSGIASALCDYEFMGWGAEGLDAVVDGFTSVTKADVDAAIKRYFDLSQSVVVIAGTF